MRLINLQVDNVTHQGTCLTSSCSLREKDYTFFWQTKSLEKQRRMVWAFQEGIPLYDFLKPPSNGSEIA